VQKLNAALLKVLQDPAVIKRIEATGSKVIGNTPEQFALQLKTEFEVYKKVVHAQKLHLD
jgi:tripartite-type tricarboxylate transporter receptor subunit TctC